MLDIVPTRHVLEHVDCRLAGRYFHWFFLSQPAELPETLIGGAPPSEPLVVWREYADDVRGHAVDAGHFLVEERPEETLDALRAFLAD